MAVVVQDTRSCLDVYISRLAQQAQSLKGVPTSLASDAAAVTRRRFGAGMCDLTPVDRRRVRAYFWGVVRGSSIRSRGEAWRDTRTLYLLMSIAEDLRSAGRTTAQILQEIEADRSLGASPEVLGRFRVALSQ